MARDNNNTPVIGAILPSAAGSRPNHRNLIPRRSARLSAGRINHDLVKEVLALRAAEKDKAEGWIDGVKL